MDKETTIKSLEAIIANLEQQNRIIDKLIKQLEAKDD